MMLALADRDGVVYGSVPGLAASAHITLEECEEAIRRFRQPDKYSSTKDHDGRRIEETIGGWKLLNYQKYRDLQSLEDIREKARLRVQNHRERKKLNNVTLPSRNVTPVTPGNRSNDIASAYAEANAKVHTRGGFNSRVIEQKPESTPSPFLKPLSSEIFPDPQETPDGLTEFEYARKLIEEIHLSPNRTLLNQVASGIKSEEKNQGGLPRAYEFVLTEAKKEIQKSGIVKGFWFVDSRWREKEAGHGKTSKAAERTQRNRENLTRAYKKSVGYPDAGSGGSDDRVQGTDGGGSDAVDEVPRKLLGDGN